MQRFPLVITVLAAATTTGQAQKIPSYSLTRPLAAPSIEFTELTAMAELPNGLILVADQSERSLVLLDPVTSRSQPAARNGSGPTEWRAVSTLLPTPGGGVYLIDFAQRRLLPFDNTGRVQDVIPMPTGQIQFRGIDAQGRLYGTVMTRSAPGIRTLADSSTIVRWDLKARRIDSLVRFNAGNSMHITLPGEKLKVFPAIDGWVALANGDVMVLEAASYRILTFSDGRTRSVARVSWDPVAVTEAEKKAFLGRPENGHPQMMGQPGKTSAQHPPSFPGYEFPATMPAFDNLMDDAIHLSPKGRIWVARTGPSGQPPSFDVLDAAGKRIAQVLLPKSAALAGFGASAVYLAEKDENDVIRLRKYPDPVQ